MREVKKQSRSVRRANIELLRILAMFMVVVMHYLYQSRVLPENGHVLDSVGVTAVVLESFCIVAVNVYVLISGYFLSVSAFSWRRVIRVIAQTLFYTVLIPLILAFGGVLPFSDVTDLYHLWNSIFPIQSGQYWFVTAYVVMCLFSPVLNAAVQNLEQKRFRQVLAALLLFFCIGKTFSPLPFATDRYGYDFGWFLVLYLLGGYIRRFGIPFFKNAGRSFGIYLGSVIGTAVIQLVLILLQRTIQGLGYYTSVPFHYNFLLCLAGAVGLFYAFLHINVKEGKGADFIRWVSPAVFGVYLIHEQADVAQRWYGWVNGLTGNLGRSWNMPPDAPGYPVSEYLVLLLLHTLIVFAVCIVIEKARGLLFSLVERKNVR